MEFPNISVGSFSRCSNVLEFTIVQDAIKGNFVSQAWILVD